MSDPRLTAADIAKRRTASYFIEPTDAGADVRMVLDSYDALRADVERLTAEHAAHAARGPFKGPDEIKAERIAVLERELAEARAEIARLHELLAEAGWTKEPR